LTPKTCCQQEVLAAVVVDRLFAALVASEAIAVTTERRKNEPALRCPVSAAELLQSAGAERMDGTVAQLMQPTAAAAAAAAAAKLTGCWEGLAVREAQIAAAAVAADSLAAAERGSTSAAAVAAGLRVCMAWPCLLQAARGRKDGTAAAVAGSAPAVAVSASTVAAAAAAARLQLEMPSVVRMVA